MDRPSPVKDLTAALKVLMDLPSLARDLTVTTLLLEAPLANRAKDRTLVTMETTGPAMPNGPVMTIQAPLAPPSLEKAPMEMTGPVVLVVEALLANLAKAHTLPAITEMPGLAVTNGPVTTIPAL
jgi:hypothetical protein